MPDQMNYPRAPIPCPCHPPPQNQQSPITNLFEKFAIESIIYHKKEELEKMFPEMNIHKPFKNNGSLTELLYYVFRSIENLLHSNESFHRQILAIQQNKDYKERIVVETLALYFQPNVIKIRSDAEIQNLLANLSYKERMFVDILLRYVLTEFQKILV